MSTDAIFPKYQQRKLEAHFQRQERLSRKIRIKLRRLAVKQIARMRAREQARMGPKPWRHKTRRSGWATRLLLAGHLQAAPEWPDLAPVLKLN